MFPLSRVVLNTLFIVLAAFFVIPDAVKNLKILSVAQDDTYKYVIR